MKGSDRQYRIIFTAAVACGIAAILLLSHTVTVFVSSAFAPAARPERIAQFALVDSALAVIPAVSPFAFDTGRAEPFAPPGIIPGARTRPRLPVGPTVPLVLKGVLLKETPLAIIIDPAGKSHICRTGDEVLGVHITGIAADLVSVVDNGYAYTLQVRER
jgi:hypothetical protein